MGKGSGAKMSSEAGPARDDRQRGHRHRPGRAGLRLRPDGPAVPGTTSMGHRNPLRIRNGGNAPLVVVVEPWATEFNLPPGAECEVIAINPELQPNLEVESLDGRLIVWIHEGGSTYEVWCDGVQLD